MVTGWASVRARTAKLSVLCWALAAALGILASVGSAVAGGEPKQQKAPTTVAQLPEPAALMIMIRSTLAAVNHANLTNNYSTLYDLGSADFKAATTPSRLSDQLKPFRDQDIDLSAVFAVTPILDVAPIVDRSGILELNGHFPTQPLTLTFRLSFRKEGLRWRHSGLAIGAEPSSGSQQKAQAPAAAE